MDVYNKYGIYRTLEPKNALPRASWKLDNSMEISKDELLLDVKIISVNEVGFNQIYDECNGDKNEIAKRILEIVNQRGKFHNPVTGTGGAIYGTVVKMGENYPNQENIVLGDSVMSFSSITLIPLKIDKILSIDTYTGQVRVSGKAVLYSHYPIIKRPKDLSLRVIVSVLDHAGTAAETARIVEKGDKVLVMGASGKIGLICAYAAKEKIGEQGQLYGIVSTQARKKSILNEGIFNQIIVTDATDITQVKTLDKSLLEGFDKVINCINYPNTEFMTIVLCKEKGTAYFSTLGANTQLASLTAEGAGKDIEIVAYKGIAKRHAEFFLDMMRRNPKLQKLLADKFNKYTYQNEANQLQEDKYLPFIKSNNKPQFFVNGEEFVFKSAKIKNVLNSVMKVSNYGSNVIIYGNSGTGKEIIGKLIHDNSTRAIFPYVKINCASIPESLLESELFGYEKGAFTGADPKGKIGYWEKANNGTLFLDEIGELSLSIQAKFLRAIQENEIYRIGSAQAIKTNVRIIAATNRNLKEMVAEGTFREDLYYRLNVYPLQIPTLKERKEDIIPLIKLFNKKYNLSFNIAKTFDTTALKYMEAMEWEGNIRELQNLVQRVMIEADNTIIDKGDILKMSTTIGSPETFDSTINKTMVVEELLGKYALSNTSFDDMIEEVERHILALYKEKYKSTRKIAAALNITQNKVARLIIKYNIK